MNLAPIFLICSQDKAVTDLLGLSPTRLYLFGSAPQNPVMPYAVWQMVGGSPENSLSDRADLDSFSLQIDVYGASASTVRQVGGAIRDAIEPYCYITSYRGESRENETQSYRTSFDVDWFVTR
ncbi:DUF3168 domain-containing protein [Gimesia sp.]|uniref:DUF3168 domain-containing protein n=1 Tax=Gimesia sp. TaxID=2024833 RepID=UPI003A8FB1C1